MLKFVVGLILGSSLVAIADDLHGKLLTPTDSYLKTAAHGMFGTEILNIQVDENGYVICSRKSP